MKGNFLNVVCEHMRQFRKIMFETSFNVCSLITILKHQEKPEVNGLLSVTIIIEYTIFYLVLW